MQSIASSSPPTTFIACLDCGVLEPDPAAREVAVSLSFKAVDTPRRATTFLHAHSRHQTTRLERREINLRSDQSARNGDSALTFAATDGEHLYVVTSKPIGNARPWSYQLRPATLQAKEPSLAVDEETIRRGLVSALFPYRLRPTTFRRFMTALHGIIRGLCPHQLDVVFEAADDLNIGIAPMPDAGYAELSRLSPTLFDPWELPRIDQFLLRDRTRESLLALRVRRELAALDA